MSRRDKLKQLLLDDPNDPFLHYALANELIKDGENEDGIQMLFDTIESHPDYVASYFRVGQALSEVQRNEEAATIVKRGIGVAERVGDAHAAGEMREFLKMIHSN